MTFTDNALHLSADDCARNVSLCDFSKLQLVREFDTRFVTSNIPPLFALGL